jgi:hypothetical protein
MACTILDAFRWRRRKWTGELLGGAARHHVFLGYIGIGFAMARLPRRFWPKVLDGLDSAPFFPVMSWLAVDGYGFDRAYFETRRWVVDQERPQPYPWQGHPSYFARAFDQGVGRALWFIHGGEVGNVADAVHRFPAHRRPDLWSGVGLAATFAGGCGSFDLVELRSAAGPHRADLALGAVFAAKARDYAGYIPQHTETAVAALCGRGVAAAVELADRTEIDAVEKAELPAYEMWRRSIRTELSAP